MHIIWALNLNRIEAIKPIKLSLTGQAVFISENIDTEYFTNSCISVGLGFQDYLQALETLFVGKAVSDLSRSTAI